MFKKSLLLAVAVLSLSAKEELVVYTYDSFSSKWGPGLDIKTSFEKKHNNCSIKYVGLNGANTILNRLKLEGARTKADIILGLDMNLLEEAKKLKIAKHEIDTSSLSIPNGWKDEYFLPFDYGYYAFVYDSKKLKNPPKSFKDFLKSKSSIIYQDPRTSPVGLGLVLWLEKLYPNSTQKAWKSLQSKTITTTKGWSEAYGMFLKGESDYVLSYTTSPAYHEMVENETRYKALSFSEGNYMQVEVAALMRKAKAKKCAREFMGFMLSEDFQQFIPTKNYMYPVIRMSLPKAYNNLSKPKALIFPSKTVHQRLKLWLKRWQEEATK